jgi:hypothetical protein
MLTEPSILYVIQCQHIRASRTDGPQLDQQLCVVWQFEDGKIVSGRQLAAVQDGLGAFFTSA